MYSDSWYESMLPIEFHFRPQFDHFRWFSAPFPAIFVWFQPLFIKMAGCIQTPNFKLHLMVWNSEPWLWHTFKMRETLKLMVPYIPISNQPPKLGCFFRIFSSFFSFFVTFFSWGYVSSQLCQFHQFYSWFRLVESHSYKNSSL